MAPPPLVDPAVDGIDGCTGEMFSSMLAAFNENQALAMCKMLADTGFITASSDAIFGLTEGLNCLYTVLCAALVFVMHAGFAMVR